MEVIVKQTNIVMALIILMGLTLPLSAATIHVPGDQPTIQAGIDAAADGDTVLVADGTYTGPGNREIDFLGKAITLRSENGAENCIVDGENVWQLFTLDNYEGETTVLDGITIANGRRNFGGGLSGSNVAPTIRNCIFRDNHSTNYGGAIYVYGPGCTIVDCRFEGNTAPYGAGIYCPGTCEIVGCTFEGNEAFSGAVITLNGSQVVEDCLILNSTGDAIRSYGTNRISGNTISGTTRGRGITSDGTVTIRDNIISGNSCDLDGAGIHCIGYHATITGNIITDNVNEERTGGGLYFGAERGTIQGNLISGNVTGRAGGGIALFPEGPWNETITVIDNRIIGNSSGHIGGGIECGGWNQAALVNNLVIGNSALLGGGVACGSHSFSKFWNMTIVGNTATQMGGGLFTYDGSDASVANSILWGNSSPRGDQIRVSSVEGGPSRLSIRYSTVEGGQAGVSMSAGATLNWWDGMIDADPMFTTGPAGDYYLSHVYTGHAGTSPCFDAGDPATSPVSGTTRVDEAPDLGVADMGYHYPLSAPGSRPMVVAGLGPGPGNSPRLRVFPPEQDATRITGFTAYGGNNYGVNLGSGDLNGDGGDELLTGPGPGEEYGAHVRGFAVNGTPLPGLSYLAYGTHKYGVNVAAGDLDADGFDEIITGPGPGEIFGPHVRGWNYDNTGMVSAMPGVSFFAYGTPKWGVNVASGDIDGDGYYEIVTGAGPGPIYGAHVRGWNVDGGAAAAIPQVSYFAYNTARMGVRVSCGDIDGDGMDEIVTAPGPSEFFPAHIRGWNYDGTTLAAMPGVNFMAWPADGYRHGAAVHAGADLDSNGRTNLVVGPGPDATAPSEVRVFALEGGTTVLRFSLQAFPDSWTYGASVSAGRF